MLGTDTELSVIPVVAASNRYGEDQSASAKERAMMMTCLVGGLRRFCDRSGPNEMNTDVALDIRSAVFVAWDGR